jgi:hypothetical protein
MSTTRTGLKKFLYFFKSLVCNELNRDQVCKPDNKTLCSCLYKYELELNDIVELVFVDEAVVFTVSHNIHLHGMPFVIMAMDKVLFKLKLQDNSFFFKPFLIFKSLVIQQAQMKSSRWMRKV